MDNNFDSKLNLYIRSERTMLDIFVRNKLRQLLWISIGFLALLTALVMFDIALFSILKAYFTTQITAFILAIANALLGLICILVSKRKKHQREAEALKDIRDFAKDEVMKDLKAVKDEVLEVGDSVGHVVRDVSSFLGTDLLDLVRLLPMLRNAIKSKKS